MKPNKFLAALTAAALAAANSALFTPTFFATAEGGFTPPGKVDGNCTANISIVDITTGESLDGFEIMLEQNPTGTGTILDRWLTTDEPVKTFTDLAAGVYYGLLISDTLKDEGMVPTARMPRPRYFTPPSRACNFSAFRLGSARWPPTE